MRTCDGLLQVCVRPVLALFRGSRWVFLVTLVASLLFSARGTAQAPPPGLQITILAGEGALNNVKQGIAREPIVQVQDENHKPVAGALVLFALPSSGPGGSFTGGGRFLSVVTDAQGEARAAGLRPNSLTGPFDIRVTAQYQGRSATPVAIHQRNESGNEAVVSHAHHFPVRAVVIGAVAAGALAGILLATHSGTHAATITAGTPSFGAP
jgi:hypothetical protein